jgi:hypothetical protein
MQPCSRLVVGQAFPPARRVVQAISSPTMSLSTKSFARSQRGATVWSACFHDTRPSCGAGGSACRIFRYRQSRRDSMERSFYEARPVRARAFSFSKGATK